MTEPVKRYGIHFAVEHMMKEDSTGEYVLVTDYERLEQECAHIREERDSFQRVGIRAMEERDTALKQVDALRTALDQAAKGIRWLQASTPMSIRVSKRASKEYSAAMSANATIPADVTPR